MTWSSRARSAAWWPQSVALVVGTAALGAALLIPYAFSDPNGLDPYVARIATVALLLAVLAYTRRALVATRPVLLALVAVTATFTLLAAGPAILAGLFGTAASARSPASPDAEVFWASLAQFALTAAAAAIAWRFTPGELRPRLRLARFGMGAALAGVVGTMLIVGVGLALPASVLGRDGLQPVALTRDLPWLWPANALQAASQELQFRGLLMGALERTMARRWANLAQATFFGLAHLAVNYEGPVGPFVPVTIAVGMLLGYVVQRTGSLWPAIIVHAAADIAIVVAVMPGLYGLS